MSGHTYKIYGRVNALGNSTEHPVDGSGSNGKWSLDTNYPQQVGTNCGKPILVYNNEHISRTFTNHRIVINVYEDTERTKLVSPTAGTIQVEATDNGVDWGTVSPTRTTFNGTGIYDRLSICGIISNIRVSISDLAPSTATGGGVVHHGVFVEVLIHSSN